MFDISRTISRNLIERLVAKHFLVSVSPRVTQVAPLTLHEIKQNFTLRKMLLPELIALDTQNVDFEELHSLNDIIQSKLPIKDDQSAFEILKTNKKLNIALCEGAGYPLALDWVCQLEDMAMRIYWLYVSANKSFPYSSEQQKLIFNVVESNEISQTRQAIHDMISQTEERVLKVVFSRQQFYTQDLKI